MEISLTKLLMRLIKKWYIIAILALLVGIIGFAVTELFIDEQYSSTSSYNVSASVGVKDADVAKRYVTVAKYDRVLDKMIEDESISKLGIDKAELRSSLILSANNEVFTAMSVVNDPETAATILRVFDDVAIPEISDIIFEKYAPHEIELIYEAGVGVKISPNVLNNSLISLTVGIFLGILAVIAPYIVFPVVEDEDDVTRITEKNVIATIPHMNIGNDGICVRFKRLFNKREGNSAPISGDNEYYKKSVALMRYKLDVLSGGEKFVIMTGTGEYAGVTSLALALAKSMSEKRTLIIECGNSSLKERCGSERAYLEDYLEGKAEFDEIVFEANGNVDIIVSEGKIDSPALSKYSELISLGEEYDFVIVDTLPIISEPATLAMTALTKNILLVTPNKERVKRLRKTTDLISDMGLNLLGIVLNNVSA